MLGSVDWWIEQHWHWIEMQFGTMFHFIGWLSSLLVTSGLVLLTFGIVLISIPEFTFLVTIGKDKLTAFVTSEIVLSSWLQRLFQKVLHVAQTPWLSQLHYLFTYYITYIGFPLMLYFYKWGENYTIQCSCFKVLGHLILDSKEISTNIQLFNWLPEFAISLCLP